MKGNKQEDAKLLTDFKSALEETLPAFGLEPLAERQLTQLATHYRMMIEWNRHLNLTRVSHPAEAARLHYAESLFAAQFAVGAQTILDIGSGAGFPALPIAVARSESQVTALEANHKKALFLLEVKDALQLDNFAVARARLEATDLRPFDLLTSRALDRADQMMPHVLRRLGAQQKLLLCCTEELVAHLQAGATQAYRVETQAIPESASRLVAIFALA